MLLRVLAAHCVCMHCFLLRIPVIAWAVPRLSRAYLLLAEWLTRRLV
jgi:hypothetical protein